MQGYVNGTIQIIKLFVSKKYDFEELNGPSQFECERRNQDTIILKLNAPSQFKGERHNKDTIILKLDAPLQFECGRRSQDTIILKEDV